VVAFLREALDELARADPRATPVVMWSLPGNSQVSYPECVVLRDRARDAWLHVYAASPSTVRLHPTVIEFLRAALADLPAHATRNAPSLSSLAAGQ
jgi:hypothetical protein